MTLDLAQFHQAFFEEGFEAIDSMEAALLRLDVGAPDLDLINTVFRVAHSIKGGSATFGFKDITSFTHTLESLLDELRGQRMQVTAGVSDLLLKSVDVLKAIMGATQRHEPVDAQAVADLQFDLEVAIANKPALEPATPSLVQRSTGWRIEFRPLPELLTHGNDPLRMFGELAELGVLEAHADLTALPPLAELDAEVCALSWTLVLYTEVTREVVETVFDWAEGECTLAITALAPAAELAVNPSSAATSRPGTAGAEVAEVAEVAETAGTAESAASAAVANPAAFAAGATPVADTGSIRVSIAKIDELMNTVGELVITQSMLTQISGRVDGPAAERLHAGLAQLERIIRQLQESVMRVRMLPISFVFSRFPRMVRDLSRRLAKQIELKMTGEQTELDKTVLEKIGDPLIHLVRNCVDHGIETPAERVAAGKTATGTLFVSAFHRGESIVVEVGDDGRGLDRDRILEKAIARGLVGPQDALSDGQIHELIFLPGFSTVEHATEISGRGVGMDVVRGNINALGGTVEISNQPGQGVRFIITLPLTLAIIDGQLVRVGHDIYVVPLVAIMESLQLTAGQTSRLAGRAEMFRFRESWIPVLRLHELFGVEPRRRESTEGLVMVVEGDGRKVGLLVDDLLDQQQVVVKSLEANCGRIAGVSGATILGEGTVALILDIPGVIRLGTARAVA
jgi:two-component system chemotaxis sensor kinase CheA